MPVVDALSVIVYLKKGLNNGLYEQKFLNIAVRESNCPNRARGALDLAEIRVKGGIAQTLLSPFTRDEYIKAGLGFIGEFAERGEQEIVLLGEELEVEEGNSESRADCLQEIICEIQDLMKQSAMIDRVEFTRLLGEDFDGQYRKSK